MSITEPSDSGHCNVCDEDVPSVDLLYHLRVMHPDHHGDGPQRWPDGALVVIDTTITPDEFGGIL